MELQNNIMYFVSEGMGGGCFYDRILILTTTAAEFPEVWIMAALWLALTAAVYPQMICTIAITNFSLATYL